MHNGASYYPRSSTVKRLAFGTRANRKTSLTKRESEIMLWVSEGKRDREIALIVGISLRTVQNHVQKILHKLSVETRTAAARVALLSKNANEHASSQR